MSTSDFFLIVSQYLSTCWWNRKCLYTKLSESIYLSIYLSIYHACVPTAREAHAHAAKARGSERASAHARARGFGAASMICGSGKVRTDGKRWRRRKASRGRRQLKNWKVMLWLMATLLALAEDVLSEQNGGPENRLDPHRRVLGRPSWRPPVPETRDHVDPLWPEAFETRPPLQDDVDAARSRWRRSPRDAKAPPTSRRKATGGSRCRVEKRQTRVRELGLGYDSDEIVLFKYCAGSCRAARRNYDLALAALAARGGISARKVSGRPCCRPTRYEAVSFMDARAMWQTIRWLSAADCGCVG
ncbi:uncharacterized protein artn [Festucalex cinctus]